MPAKRPSRRPAPLPISIPVELSIPKPAISLPEAEGWWKALGLVLSLIEPAAGLVLALLYWPALDEKAKSFARWCLVLAVVGLVFSGAADTIENGMSAGEWMIQPY